MTPHTRKLFFPEKALCATVPRSPLAPVGSDTGGARPRRSCAARPDYNTLLLCLYFLGGYVTTLRHSKRRVRFANGCLPPWFLELARDRTTGFYCAMLSPRLLAAKANAESSELSLRYARVRLKRKSKC